MIFDVPGHASLQRVPMLEPQRGTRAHVGALLDRSPDATTLLRELWRRQPAETAGGVTRLTITKVDTF